MESRAASLRAGVVGRGAELAAISEFVAHAGDGRAVLVLEGDAGIGKTTVWRAAVEEAGTSCRVLVCRPAETESEIAFAALTELLAPVGDDVLASLPGPQREALEIALLRREPGDVPSQRFAISLAAHAVVRTLAASDPVLLAVDDLQWLDVASARVLAHVVRRLDREPVRVLATHRLGTELPRELDRWCGDEEERRRLEGLSLAALHHLFAERLDARFPRPTLVRLRRASGGNPFFALELARSLQRTGIELRPDLPLPVPQTLRELIGERLARLPAAAREAVLVAYALPGATAEAVESALALARRSRRGLAQAIDGEALVRRNGSVEPAHPLIGSVLYGELTAERRRALHGRLAQVAEDVEEQARHLALAARAADEGVAARLEQAADRARGRGGLESAVELLELAVELTPEPEQDRLWRRRLALMRDVCDSASYTDETRLARALRLVEEAPPGRARAEALLLLAAFFFPGADRPELGPWLERALAEVRGEPELEARIELARAMTLRFAGRMGEAEGHARAAVEAAEHAGDPAVLALALTSAAFTAFQLGRDTWVELLERGVELERQLERPLPFVHSASVARAGLHQGRRDDLARARGYLEEVRDAAVERGETVMLVEVLWLLGEVECWAGNLELAARLAEEGEELARRTDFTALTSAYLSTLGLIDAYAGRLDEARAKGEAGLAAPLVPPPVETRLRALLAFVELSAARPEAALQRADGISERRHAAGLVEPSGYRALPEEVEALVLLGRLDEAEEALRPFEQAGERLGRRWAQATARRCRGLLLAARGDLDAALAALEEAVSGSEELGQPLELGRALFAQGVVARRAKRKGLADEALRRAEESFAGLGNEVWAERARAERGRVGLRPHAPGELTETERRVAELAAAGRRNGEIAADLFMSTRAVEANLTRTYRKLGVRSRSELARRLAGGVPS